jgi:hypothetical protein
MKKADLEEFKREWALSGMSMVRSKHITELLKLIDELHEFIHLNAQYYLDETMKVSVRLSELHDQKNKLTEGLKFYADPENWKIPGSSYVEICNNVSRVNADHGQLARHLTKDINNEKSEKIQQKND